MSAGVATWFPFGIVVGLAASVAPSPGLRLVLAGMAFVALFVTLAVLLVWTREGGS